MIEVNVEAGAVALIHPFVLRARSPNVGSKVRFICNPCFSLKEPMRLDRTPPIVHSPVELAIRRALGNSMRVPKAAATSNPGAAFALGKFGITHSGSFPNEGFTLTSRVGGGKDATHLMRRGTGKSNSLRKELPIMTKTEPHLEFGFCSYYPSRPGMKR